MPAFFAEFAPQRSTSPGRRSRCVPRSNERMEVHMRLVSATFLGAAVCACVGCLSCCWDGMRGSGVLVTKTYDYRDFTALRVGSVFRVEAARGDAYGLEVTVDDNLVQYLRVEQHAASVSIRLADNVNVRDATLRARVTMPALEQLDVGGVSQVELKGFRGGASLAIAVEGVSKVFGSVEASELAVSASGVSHVALHGSARTVRADVNGTSTVELDDFRATDARVHVDGCSKASVNVGGTLDYSVSGVSTLTYAGSPRMGAQSVSGCSHVAPR
jgi:hypothetical protein